MTRGRNRNSLQNQFQSQGVGLDESTYHNTCMSVSHDVLTSKVFCVHHPHFKNTIESVILEWSIHAFHLSLFEFCRYNVCCSYHFSYIVCVYVCGVCVCVWCVCACGVCECMGVCV